MIELTELQALDFAFGAYLAGAFAGYAPDKGPKGWQEFISRPVKRQIFRHDADTPAEFMRDFLNTQKDRKDIPATPPQAGALAVNTPLFPVVYYFRKPGIVNTQDQKGPRGRVWNNNKPFDLKVRPVAIDYSLIFLAWDKLTLDKLTLAWYHHVYDHDQFYYPTEIGGETFDIMARMPDNKNVMIQNASDTVDGKRLYAAAATPVSVATNILIGRGLESVGTSRLIYGYSREDDEQYVVTPTEGTYTLDTADKGGSHAINPGTVRVVVGARIVATDDGKGHVTGTFEQEGGPAHVTGTVDYYNGTVSWTFDADPVGAVSVAFKPLEGRVEVS